MNQSELINAIADSSDNEGVSKRIIKWVLDTQGDIVRNALASEGEATLSGIGKLSVKNRQARKGRNPATGEEMDIPEKNVPHFSAAKALKDAVA